MLRRLPCPALRPFVELVWTSEDGDAAAAEDGTVCERVLPTGAMHLVLRTGDDPVRVFLRADDRTGAALAHAVVGGARAAPYLRSASRTASTVGAMLRPGAARVLFRATADALAGRHTPLEELWGAAAAEALERVSVAGSAARRLDVLESLLRTRLPLAHGLHPAVAEALALLPSSPEVARLVAGSGYSHRHFIALFREAVGLAPKLYARVLRFQRALTLIRAPSARSLGEVALAAGYADQAHFSREFLEFSGLSPGHYRRLAPSAPNHVPGYR